MIRKPVKCKSTKIDSLYAEIIGNAAQKKNINFKHRIYHSQTLKIAGVMRLIHARSTQPDLDKNIY